jgi:hypothetical protein
MTIVFAKTQVLSAIREGVKLFGDLEDREGPEWEEARKATRDITWEFTTWADLFRLVSDDQPVNGFLLV